MSAIDPKKLRSRRTGSSDSDSGPYLSLELGSMGGDGLHADGRSRLDSETDELASLTPARVTLPRSLLGTPQAGRQAGVPLIKSNKLDSFDFDTFESFVHRESLNAPDSKASVKSLHRWLLIFVSATLIGLVAVLITYSTRHLLEWKFNLMHEVIASAGDNKLENHFRTLATLLGLSLAFALLAAIPVALISPAAGGSGIPALKCVLNGVKIPEILRIKTLLCKIFSVTFAVAAGLPMGKEGPMIHNGAIVASGVSGRASRLCNIKSFRRDREKRDFIVSGAAAGVAAAFGAPVGGLLFALEEAASFWFQSLTWRAFVCAMIATYVLDMFLSGINKDSSWGRLSRNAMFTFGDFTGIDTNRSAWNVYEIPFFLIIGALGGFIGAVFNAIHKRLSIWRSRVIRNKWIKIVEVLVITSIMVIGSFVIPIALGVCTPLPEDATTNGNSEDYFVPFYCPHGEYSLLASLFLAPADNVIKLLFHYTTISFDLPRLFLFFGFYLLMACLTLGTSIAAGLFYPSMVAGAALGRILGQLLQMTFSNSVVDPGTYAFIGCAAMLGGCMRMTVSVAVMMLESTGDYQYGLPIMATLIAARWTGNLFNHSVYDVSIELQHWPHLEDHIKKSVASNLVVADIMSPNPVVFREVEKVGTIIDVLRGTKHNGFPVLHATNTLEYNPRLGTLAGLMLRQHLCVLLQKKAFTPEPPPDFVRGEYFTWFIRRTARQQAASIRDASLVHWYELEDAYPYFPDPNAIILSNQERECWMDLRPYINRTVYTVNRLAPVARAFRLFRTLGLRHLIAVNDFGDCVGILTRAELVEDHVIAAQSSSSSTSAQAPYVGSNGFTALTTRDSDGDPLIARTISESRARAAVRVPSVATLRPETVMESPDAAVRRRSWHNQWDFASLADSENPFGQ